jgi:SurA N-terminal domain
MFRSKYVKVALGALVAGVVLAGCDNPVKMGAAATVGSQRISDTTLNNAVTDWKTAMAKDPLNLQNVQLSDQSSIPRSVLTWLIDFKVGDEAARQHGITVVPGQLDSYRAAYEQASSQQGQPSLTVQALANGIPPSYLDKLVRFLYVRSAILRAAVPGQQDTQAGEAAVQQAMVKAAKKLNIKISPRYGSFNVQQVSLAPVKTSLSIPESGT